MNSQQLNFYILPDEQEWFESQLRRQGDLVVIRDLSSLGAPVLADSTVVREMGKENLRIYLTRSADVSHIVGRPIPTRSAWSVDEMRAPAVEFSRCYFDGKSLLRRGRLYVTTRYYDGDALIEKPKEFLDWTKALLSAAKKELVRREDGDYITRRAKAGVDAGMVELALT